MDTHTYTYIWEKFIYMYTHISKGLCVYIFDPKNVNTHMQKLKLTLILCKNNIMFQTIPASKETAITNLC